MRDPDSEEELDDGESVKEDIDDDSDSDGDQAEDEEEDEDDDDDATNDVDISAFVKSNDKFKQLEESVADKAVNNAVSEEIRKGQSIANQMKVWDKLLEYRIQFQRVLALANQLPPCDVFKETMKDFLASPENARLYRQCVRNVERAFEQLAMIRAELVRKYPEMKKSLDGKHSADSGDEEIPSGGEDDDDFEIPSDIASGYSEDEDGQPKRKKAKQDERVFDEDREAKDHPNGDSGKRKKFILSETNRANEEFHQKFFPFR